MSSASLFSYHKVYTYIHPSLANIDNRFLNPIGKIPLISFYSGGFRVMLGSALITLTLIMKIMQKVEAVFKSINISKGLEQASFRNSMLNGAASIGRGTLEMSSGIVSPFLSLLNALVVKVVLVVYDNFIRVNYPGETKKYQVMLLVSDSLESFWN